MPLRNNKLKRASQIVLLALLSLPAPSAPLRVAIIGLEHGHASGFLNGGSALVPAGGALHRPDVEVVGIVEPRRELFDSYAKRLNIPTSLYFASLGDLVAKVHPEAALVFTSTLGHTAAVEECARHGIHVMMEKPLAVSYRDALAMAEAAKTNHVHVLVDYETTWYGSNKAAHDLLADRNNIGEVRKVIVRDGHRGPKLINVSPEFFSWLTDPKENGAGALYDFGCYGADLMTWLMAGEVPQSVTAVTKQLQPDVYPKVDDETDILLTYKNAIAIVQGSWNWPFDIKDMDVYGRTGYVKTIKRDHIEVRRPGQDAGQTSAASAPPAPYDDPLHYVAAVIRGEIQDDGLPSSLDTNLIVSEILDAARQSAQSGKTVRLPLPH
ncbi:MAG: Gfo/Idh/MocA family oxidoreductase [Acidobacteriaceae bacterium]|nr:Gfo/Idh/MocA family oxidoreductase [Acidobacteriaceae bacterium]